MKKAAAVVAMFLCLLAAALPAGADPRKGEGDSLETAEKDLLSILREMDALQSELDRLEELAAFPKATGIRVEIHRKGSVPAPSKGRLLVQGNLEEERDWTKAERDAFSGAVPVPVVFQMPYLPGTYRVRFEVFHPSWKNPPSAEFSASVRKGEIATVRFELSPPAGKEGATLSLLGGK